MAESSGIQTRQQHDFYTYVHVATYPLAGPPQPCAHTAGTGRGSCRLVEPPPHSSLNVNPHYAGHRSHRRSFGLSCYVQSPGPPNPHVTTQHPLRLWFLQQALRGLGGNTHPIPSRASCLESPLPKVFVLTYYHSGFE